MLSSDDLAAQDVRIGTPVGVPKPPPITFDLIDWLQGVFPDKIPQLPIPREEEAGHHFFRLIGQQEVIRRIKATAAAQLRMATNL